MYASRLRGVNRISAGLRDDRDGICHTTEEIGQKWNREKVKREKVRHCVCSMVHEYSDGNLSSLGMHTNATHQA